jgi:hypothetical protein
MIRFTWIVSLAAMAATGACAVVQTAETKTYDLAGFDSVSASNGVNVELRQGPFSVKAEGPRDRLDRLHIERRGSELVIRRDPTMSWGMWSMRDVVTVVAPAYTSISVSGGVDLDADNLTFEDLRVSMSGGADLNISGACKTLTLETSGGADFNGEGLKCATANVSSAMAARTSPSMASTARLKATPPPAPTSASTATPPSSSATNRAVEMSKSPASNWRPQ